MPRRAPRLLFGLVGVLLLLLAAAGRAEEAAGYLRAIADLPLMPGLAEVSGAGVAFDTPAGRIVEAYAQGPLTAAEVEAFYRRTLPQLGWSEAGPLGYLREGERLSLEVLSSAEPLVLRFSLRPR